jgi:hypothetical protein
MPSAIKSGATGCPYSRRSEAWLNALREGTRNCAEKNSASSGSLASVAVMEATQQGQGDDVALMWLWVAEIRSRIEMIDWRGFAGKLWRYV